ncbi:MAG TPA: hypothetical protein VHY91_14070 [Pirellulales bacterium]|jgi:hypothetical protein|nr:hypothetical protein [Pirellulales bacterium]
MRRHFSFTRLAIVVAWAALSPQGALLVHNWTSQLLGADGFDSASVAGDFDTGWSRWSDHLDSITKTTAAKDTAAKNSADKNTAAKNIVTEAPATEKSVTEKVGTPATENRPTQPANSDRQLTERAPARHELAVAGDLAAGSF